MILKLVQVAYHAQLKDLKQLSARHILFNGFDRLRLAAGEADFLTHMLSNGSEAAKSPTHLDDETKLCAHNQFVAEQIEQYCPKSASKMLSENGLEKLKSFSTSISSQARQISCATCVGVNGHICNGSPSKDRKAFEDPERKPLCLLFIREVFDMCLERTNVMYEAAKRPGEPALVNVALEVSLSAMIDDVQAFTEFPKSDEAGRRTAKIKLKLPILKYEDRHYLELPYYIAHELAVHAPQTILMRGPREPEGSDNAFTEGLIDKVIFSEVDRWLRNPGRQHPLPNQLRERRDDARKALANLRGRRVNKFSKEPLKRFDIPLQARSDGLEAHRRLLALVRSDVRLGTTSLNSLLLKANVELQPTARRVRFVDRILENIHLDEGMQGNEDPVSEDQKEGSFEKAVLTPRALAFKNILAGYHEGNSTDKLVADLDEFDRQWKSHH